MSPLDGVQTLQETKKNDRKCFISKPIEVLNVEVVKKTIYDYITAVVRALNFIQFIIVLYIKKP